MNPVALKYGPLIYNVETADNHSIDAKIDPATPLRAEWRPDLFGGTMVIIGKWQTAPMLVAIPNYARMNRVGPPPAYPQDEPRPEKTSSKVWI